MQRLISPVVLTSSRMRSDKSCGLSISTNELTDEEWILLKHMQNQSAFMLLQVNELTKEHEDIFDNIDEDLYDTKRTPSQRLRGVLYLLHKQQNPGLDDTALNKSFKQYYADSMEKLINHFKEKLD